MIIDIAYPSCRQRRRRRRHRRRRRQRFNLPVWFVYVRVLKTAVPAWPGLAWALPPPLPLSRLCVLFTSAETEIQAKQNESQPQQQTATAAAAALNFAASVAACAAGVAALGATRNSTTSRRRLSLSSFLQLCLLPTNTDSHSHTHHTTIHIYILCSFAVVVSPPAHTFLYCRSLALLQHCLFYSVVIAPSHFDCLLPACAACAACCCGCRKCFCFWFICGNPLGFVAIAFAFMLS